MTTWRDQLKSERASFRGVQFFVETAERAGGRRVVKHEYPFRNAPSQEDLGRKTRVFPVEGHVLGDDYLSQRDDLITQLEGLGPGELVHPFYGRLKVVCLNFRVRETMAEGGIARFSIDFEEAPDRNIDLVQTVDGAALVASSVTAASTAIGLDFLTSFVTSGAPAAALASLTNQLLALRAKVSSAVGPFVQGVQALASFTSAFDVLTSQASTLVRDGAAMLAGLQGAFASLPGSALVPRVGLSALLDLYDFAPGLHPSTTTATRVREGRNFDALQQIIQRLVVVQGATLAPAQTFDSYDDAAALRDRLTGMIDDQLASAGDESVPALMQLRADLIRAVPGEDSSLARLVQVTPPSTVPSLVLAYSLYGDVTLELDLMLRNHVAHPGFVLGGVALEALSSG